MESYEFVIPGRPVSVRANDRAAHRLWVEHVKDEATLHAPVVPVFWEPTVRLTIVFFCEPELIDVDNVIPPIQNALEPLFYPDDRLVCDVECHRRTWDDDVDPDRLPCLLREHWRERRQCVYVRVEETRKLEELL